LAVRAFAVPDPIRTILEAKKNMRLSLKSLVGMALQDWESDRSWKAISELQMRGSPEALALAQRLAKSRNGRKRSLGQYIASQLRQRNEWRPFGSTEYALEDTQEILLAGLHDTHIEVVCAAISGLGHRPHQKALSHLLKFATHQDQRIRFEVAIALGRYSETDSIDALLRLATDQSDDVRNWATFGIGSMQDADNPKIRDLLWANLQDKDEDVRSEALVGLAYRKDERIIPVLLELLDTNCRVFELDAAEIIASPLLLARLTAIKDSVSTLEIPANSYWYGHVLDAIEACGAKLQ
jgi:HEAT repeat protein